MKVAKEVTWIDLCTYAHVDVCSVGDLGFVAGVRAPAYGYYP